LDKLKEESEILNKINELIRQDKDITITRSFKKEDYYFNGKIDVTYLSESLTFDVN